MKKYIPIVYAIDELIKEGKISRFEKEELQTYVKYSLCGRKMFNVDRNGSKDGWVYFHFDNADIVAKQINDENLFPISREEAMEKHLGRAKAVYKGQNFEVIKKMLLSI